MHYSYQHALRAEARNLPHSRFLPLCFSLYLEPPCSRNSSLHRPSPATSWSGLWAYRSLQAVKSERKGSKRTAEVKGEIQTHWDTGQQQESCSVLRRCSGLRCYPSSGRATSRWQMYSLRHTFSYTKEAPVLEKHICKTCLCLKHWFSQDHNKTRYLKWPVTRFNSARRKPSVEVLICMMFCRYIVLFSFKRSIHYHLTHLFCWPKGNIL